MHGSFTRRSQRTSHCHPEEFFFGSWFTSYLGLIDERSNTKKRIARRNI